MGFGKSKARQRYIFWRQMEHLKAILGGLQCSMRLAGLLLSPSLEEMRPKVGDIRHGLNQVEKRSNLKEKATSQDFTKYSLH
jgi:hypothetical protein